MSKGIALSQRAKRRVLSIWLVLTLTACVTVGPDYKTPDMKVPMSWQATLPHGGNTTSLLYWWESFNDPVLSDLLLAAETDNPTLNQAAAAINSARATRNQVSAKVFPSINASASQTQSGTLKSTDNTPTNAVLSSGLDASWEIDLFGAVQRGKEAATATVQARQADWHDARVSLAAEVANEYVNYRACQLLVQNDQKNLESLKQTALSTSAAVNVGLTSAADGALATASAANAAATLNNQQTECDIGVKSLVALTDLEEMDLREKLGATAQKIPSPATLNITTLPVQLLSQRPDLISAERTLATASANIGAAEANRYPRLSLLGSISINNNNASSASVQTSLWSFGPSLSVPIFDGGALRAQVAVSQANYDSALALYQGTVRRAVKETEQSLIRLDAANRRSKDVNISAVNYRRYFDAAYQSWRAGTISLLTLEEARRNALQAEQNAITVERDRVLYGIALYKSLGGGWNINQDTSTSGVSP